MNILKKVVFALVLALAVSLPATAQTFLNGTTLSATINSTQTQFIVASATNVVAGGALYIDHEYMDIVAVNSTTVTVNRSSRPAAHVSGASVIVATMAQKPNVFKTKVNLAGLCVLTDYQFLPIVDIDTGNIYSCRYPSAGAAARAWQINNSVGYNAVGSVPTAWR